MKPIHKRSDSRFLRAVAALLFLGVCAYVGAALYARLSRSPTEMEAPLPAAAALRFCGICLREEQPMLLPASARLTVGDGQRIAAGGLLAVLADGTDCRAERSALYFAACDGFETLRLSGTPDAASLRQLLDAAPAPEKNCRGRLVLDNIWYYAALAPAEAELPAPGACRLRFAGKTEWIPARLLAVSEADEGQRALLFRLSRGGDYLSLRKIEAELALPG